MLNIDSKTKTLLRANAELLVHILTDETTEPEITKLDIDAFISQLTELKQDVEHTIPETDIRNAGMMDWKLRMLEYIIPDGIDRDADRLVLAQQKTRLVNALMSIPDANCFLALMRKFITCTGEGITKIPRPGREDDIRCKQHEPTDANLKSAIEFLRRPARIRYILTGESELNTQLDTQTRGYLNNQRSIFIPEDFERLTTTELLLDEELDANTIRQIITTRAYKEHIKLEKFWQEAH